MEMGRLMRDGVAEPSRETEFSGANADREISIFPVQLTTSRITVDKFLVEWPSPHRAVERRNLLLPVLITIYSGVYHRTT